MSRKQHKFSKSKLVISYARFSSPEQGKGDSSRRQSSLADEWCKAKKLILTDRLDDRGISAFRGRNRSEGALASFLELVQAGTVPAGSILLVEELDRISRQEPEESLHLFLSIVRSGITIVTLNTGDTFEKGKIDMGKLMVSVVKFCTAHDESAKKSYRIGESWKAKRANLHNKPMTARTPAWIKLDKVKGKFNLIPEKVVEVKRIFKLAKSGHGLNKIMTILNATVPEGEHFARSSILTILNNRATIGEFQAHSLQHKDGKKRRIPAGEPIKGYFPPVISEGEFYAVQAGLKKRKLQTGPSGKWTNLFTGLLHHVDGSTVRVRDGGYGKRYCSAAALEARNGAGERVQFPCCAFEAGVMFRIGNHNWRDGEDDSAVSEEIQAMEGRIEAVNTKIKTLSASIVSDDINPALSAVGAVLNKLDLQKRGMLGELEQLKAKATTTTDTDLAKVKHLVQQSADAAETKLSHDDRLKLRGIFQRLLKWIKCDFHREGLNYKCKAQICLHNDKVIDWAFDAQRIDTMQRVKGRPVKTPGKSPIPKFEVTIPLWDKAYNKHGLLPLGSPQ